MHTKSFLSPSHLTKKKRENTSIFSKHPLFKRFIVKPVVFILTFVLTIGHPSMVPSLWAGPTIIDVKISSSSYDAEEKKSTGQIYKRDDILDIGTDGYDKLVGLRFRYIDIPQNATITKAYIQFTAQSSTSSAATFTIHAEDTDDARYISSSNFNISSRTRTSAVVNWTPGSWTASQKGLNERTPDISSLVQEVVTRPGWDNRNDMFFILEGTGDRKAYSRDGSYSDTPVLHIEYTNGNQAPTVDAGPLQNITLSQQASLNPTVSDDGLPNNTLTYQWSKVSGPGNVTFQSADSKNTSASFNQKGYYTLQLHVSDGVLSNSDLIDINVGNTPVINLQISASNDDAEEKLNDGQMYLTGNILEMGETYDELVALRFPNVTIPKNEQITKAYIQFTARSSTSTTAALTIHAEDTASAGSYGPSNFDISSRTRTSAVVNWAPGSWTADQAGLNERTADISSLVQEVVNRQDWTSGNALAFIIGGTVSNRKAHSYDGNSTYAPKLHIEYGGQQTNQPPVVDAGVSQNIVYLTQAVLNPTVSDDGLPNNTVTYQWSKVSGPGNVTFQSASSKNTSASFNLVGQYTLQLQASDGALSGTDTIDITVAAPTLEPLPNVTGPIAGYTSGQFDVSERGSANYNIPISVLPGTGGMEPKLALTYDSRQTNGLLGVGWSLNGLSTITRCPTTIAQDGYIDGVDFDNNDKLCLDGQRLVVTNGTYMGQNSEYRTENETFTKIQASPYHHVGAPTYFTTWTKAGLKYVYGSTVESRVEAQGRSDILLWRANFIADSMGNYIWLGYHEDQTIGESYVTKIEYTGNVAQNLSSINTIDFVYEDRPDDVVSHLSGSKTTVRKRLKTIELKHNGNLVREYRLSYQQGLATKRSQLIEVKECDAQGVCLNPTTFDYTDGAISFGTPSIIASSSSAGALGQIPFSDHGNHDGYGDFNGDGKFDKLWLDEYGPSRNFVGLSGAGSMAVQYWPVTKPSSMGSGNLWTITTSTTGQFEGTYDFNGDGLTDRAFRYSSDDQIVLLSSGSGFGQAQIWTDASNYPNITLYGGGGRFHDHYGDINGDGRTDRVWIPGVWGGDSGVWATLSEGNKFGTPTEWITEQGMNLPGGSCGNNARSYSYFGQHEIVQDFNGDGLADYMLSPRCRADWQMAKSTGSSFEPPVQWLVNNAANGLAAFSSDGKHEHFADITGDGLPDFAWVPIGSNDLWVAINNGNGFNTPSIWVPNGTIGGFKSFSQGGKHARFTDLNGDGRADYMLVPEGSTNIYVLYSEGDKFSAPQILLSEFLYQSAMVKLTSGNARHEQAGDITGDGLFDFIWRPSGRNELWGAVNLGTKPDVLKEIINGHGAKTTIEYKPLTDSTVYRKGTVPAAYPQINIQSPMQVVSAHTISDGLGGDSRFTYYYEDLKATLDGRGFCGFQYKEVTNQQTGVKVATFYEQQFPFKSLVKAINTRLADDTLIQSLSNTWKVKNFPSGNYFVYIERKVEGDYELNGQLTRSVTTTTTYDDFGNALTVDTLYNDGHLTKTANTFTNDTANWFLGRLTQSQVTKTAVGQLPITKTSSFVYDTITGLLSEETIEPGHATLELKKQYVRDGFGNITQSIISGPTITSRIKRTVYDSTGRFAVESENALNQKSLNTYDTATGHLLTSKDPNNVETQFQYDRFDRQTLVTHPNQTLTRTLYHLYSDPSLPNAVYYIRRDSSGTAPIITYYDQLDRDVRQETVGFNGQKIFIDKRYNTKGQLAQKSEPYFENSAPLWTVYQYDDKGRAIQITQPSSRVTSTQYSGLTTTTTNPLNQKQTIVLNPREKILLSRDDKNKTLTYTYDSSENLTAIKDPNLNETTMTYDIRGNKTGMTEPNTGTTTYIYNELGLLTSRTNAKSQTVTYEYDLLNRRTKRTEPEGITTWLYDNRPNGIGKLGRVTGPSGFAEEYTYDTLSRPVQTETVINFTSYKHQQTYDIYGRQDTLTYPSDFSILYAYDTNGYLTTIRKASGFELIWKQDRANARGQLEQATLGNGLSIHKTYDANTGFTKEIKSGVNQSNTAQNLQFTFDAIGNLKSRSDLNRNLVENFVYDSLNRLTDTQVVGGYNTNVQYDSLGNITYKSDVGTYQYGQNGAGPHAVTSITGLKTDTFGYDANGNRISSNTAMIQYSSYNKPTVIDTQTARIEFKYGPNRARFKQTKLLKANNTTTSKIYIGQNFERVLDGTDVENKHYIFAGDELVSIHQIKNSVTEKQFYLHKDHLGSIQTITDDNGAVVETLSYDAWGLRRSGTTWQAPTGNESSQVDRGFTGHEHLDDVSLVHMNGRVYDPITGRFLSADSPVQSPENLQNLNRYSYVLNNPLSYTDPSGHFFKHFFKIFRPLFKSSAGQLLTTAFLAVAFGPWVAGFKAPLAQTAAVASIASGTTLVATEGDLSAALKSGAISFATAYAFGVVGDHFGPKIPTGSVRHVQKIIAHGAVGGASAILQGGKFEHGFLSAGIVQTFAPGIDSGLDGADLKPFRILAAGVIGGTASELGGGSFANGAATAAFSRLFNDEAHRNSRNINSKNYKYVDPVLANADRAAGIGSRDISFDDLYRAFGEFLEGNFVPITEALEMTVTGAASPLNLINNRNFPNTNQYTDSIMTSVAFKQGFSGFPGGGNGGGSIHIKGQFLHREPLK